jgi:hypothetical protein
MHTALRKACDSQATSLAYNLINLLCALPARDVPVRFAPWLIFGALVVERCVTWPAFTAIGNAIEMFEGRFSEVCDRARSEGVVVSDAAPSAMTAFFALKSALDLLDEGDVAGMASFFEVD